VLPRKPRTFNDAKPPLLVERSIPRNIPERPQGDGRIAGISCPGAYGAEKGWSQAELAERVRVSRNSINAIENGRFDPSLPLAFRIADAFDLSVEEVFDKTDV